MRTLHIFYNDSYKLSFNAEDETSEGKFFAYDAQARAIIKRDVVAVAKQQAREPGFPRFLTEAISRKFSFHVMLTEDSYSDIHDKTWLVKSVLVDHEFEAIRATHRAQIQAQDVASPGSTGGVADVHATQHAANVPVPALTQQVLTTQSGAVCLLHYMPSHSKLLSNYTKLFGKSWLH